MAMVAAMVATVVHTYIGWYLDAVLSQKSKHLLYPFTTKCVQVFASPHIETHARRVAFVA